MNLTQEKKKEIYAQLIDVLFAGAVKARPEDITQDVAMVVGEMMQAIAKCSQNFAKFGFVVVYQLTIGVTIGFIIDSFLESKLVSGSVSFVLSQWVMKLLANRQFAPCVNSARAAFRSKIEIALMGLF